MASETRVSRLPRTGLKRGRVTREGRDFGVPAAAAAHPARPRSHPPPTDRLLPCSPFEQFVAGVTVTRGDRAEPLWLQPPAPPWLRCGHSPLWRYGCWTSRGSAGGTAHGQRAAASRCRRAAVACGVWGNGCRPAPRGRLDGDLGRCGGTVGAIFTCPLEVIKTRLQSSRLALRTVYYPQVHLGTISGAGVMRPTSVTPGLLQVLKSILEKEGPKSLFRGLGPNLVGVAPSRAVYFACYSKAKEQFNGIFVPNSNTVHIFSAGSAAFVTNTLMNPIWMVKTRMQLERKVRGCKQMNTLQCARHVYQTEGIRGFYRGLTASYAGISETIICFAIYESLKKCLKEAPVVSSTDGREKSSSSFFGLMAAAAVSKGCASCIAYPHEVIRTRLREEGSKYKSFVQTARLVFREEGYLAFYRGLFAQLIRQIPNTAIVLSTYEFIVYLLGERA